MHSLLNLITRLPIELFVLSNGENPPPGEGIFYLLSGGKFLLLNAGDFLLL
jgi:hypothetical protein